MDTETTETVEVTGSTPEIRRLDDAAPERTVIDDLADGKQVSDGERIDALAWFLSDDEDEAEFTKKVELDVGPPGREVWMEWVIRPLDADEIRSIQNMGNNRAARRRGQTDPDLAKANRRIVIAATVHPDLRQIAGQKGVADPDIALKHRFRHKPLLLDQLAAEILGLSGADDEAIRDAREVRAARD